MNESFSKIQYPLFDFFLSLRDHGFKLNIDDYDQFLKAIKGGFGIESKEKLFQLCQLLWLKDLKDVELYQSIFNTGFEANKKSLFEAISSNEAKKYIEVEKKLKEDTVGENQVTKGTDESKNELNDKTTDDIEKNEQTKLLEDDIETIYLSLGDDLITENEISIEKKDIEQAYHFVFSRRNFYPLADRHLQLLWRNFRKELSEPDHSKIAIDECVEDICKNKYLSTIHYQYKTENKAQLLSLVDIEGSMTIFKWLSEQVLNTASTQLNNDIFYFENIPFPKLYSDKEMQKSLDWEISLQRLYGKAVLVISDAGAVNQSFNKDRIESTRKMIKQIKKFTNSIAWLNPMPANKWINSSAEFIKEFVPMFECNETGIALAIKTIKSSFY